MDTFRQKYSSDPALKEFANEIKSLAEGLEEHIRMIEKCRESSIALTKLEECVMWAVKAIYIADDNK